MTALRNLDALLKPRAIAIVGATPDVRRVGGRPLSFLRRYAFPGRIYPINPKYDNIDGTPCFPSIDALTDTPDLAVIAVPATGVLDAVRACQTRGIPAINIYTSGFGEIGAEGQVMQDALRDMAERHGTVICGPNSQGVANFLDNMCANFSSTLGRDKVAPGPVAFAGQSGLFAGVLAAECYSRGLGIGYLISTGNEVAADISDFIAYMAADPRIRVVAGYLEGVRDGGKLLAAARAARAHGKPVVILKVGRSADSAAAAASHTGSLAGSYEIYQAAFRQAGVIEVDDIEAFYDAIELFATGATATAGNRIGIVTNSGGIGVFASDKVLELGMAMAKFGDPTTAAISERLPAFGSPRNPVDFTLQAFHDAESVGSHVRNVKLDDNVDAVAAFFGVQMLNIPAVVDAMSSANAVNQKPMVVGWMHGDPDGPKGLRAVGIPTFADPLRALKALRTLVDFGRAPAPATTPQIRAGKRIRSAADMISGWARQGRRQLAENAGKTILAAAGVPVARAVLAADAEAAVRAAEDIGYPVVLKVESADIPHKTEAGGVRIGIDGPASVRTAFSGIMAAARAYAPTAVLDGVSVHEFIDDATELIVGIKRDPVFGPVILLGAGGILAEILKDTALRVLPLSEGDAEAMIGSLSLYPVLAGARGRPPRDVAAVAEVVQTVAALALVSENLAELDINPLMVRKAGEGVRAADALITLDSVDY